MRAKSCGSDACEAVCTKSAARAICAALGRNDGISLQISWRREG